MDDNGTCVYTYDETTNTWVSDDTNCAAGTHCAARVGKGGPRTTTAELNTLISNHNARLPDLSPRAIPSIITAMNQQTITVDCILD